MKYSDWIIWKEGLISKYQPDKIIINTDELLEFILGSYGFRFRGRASPIQFKGQEIEVVVNPQYCFIHIGIWRDLKNPSDINLKLAIAKTEADKSERFSDKTNLSQLQKEKLKRRESKIRSTK